MNTQLVLLLAYSVALVGVGLLIGRQVIGAKDFFVAGRGLGPGLIFSTLLAANIGAGSTVGAAGLGYRDGLSAWWWVGSAGVGSVVLALWIGPAMRREAAAHDLRTVGDYLEHRYSALIRGMVALLLWLGALAILAGQLIAISTILNVVVSAPKWVGCVVGGVLITIYSTAGGLKASAWVNMVQLAVKMVGFAVALPLALGAVGGWPVVSAMTPPSSDYWDFWSGGASGVVYLALLGPAFIVSPGLLQKLYGARDDRSVRLGVGLNAIGLLLYAIIPVVLGMIARVRFPQLPTPDLALPMVLMHGLPAAIGTLGLAAVFSAELSAADAVLFMLTTSLSQDLYKRFVVPTADEQHVLLVARVTTVVAGALGTAVAIVAPSVIAVLSIFYTLLGVSLFVPILGGLFVTRAGTREAMASIVAGVGIVLVLQAVTAGRGYSWMSPALLGLIAASVVFGLVLVMPRSRAATARNAATR
ncbi:MAG: sodium:solute symporter family protein [Acidobacteria bacterium]|nr:sodium:solute symporter family protein [Acidobacteriota bacterium]